MGRKSIKENKNIYQLSREAADMTREVASEKMIFLSADRIEKIESEKTLPRPEEILAMAECYRMPSLCNHFCSHECPIGQKYVPEVQAKELSQITLEMLSTLNTLEKEKDRLVEITVDGEITADEITDFQLIQKDLVKMSVAIDSLKLWISNTIASGRLDSTIDLMNEQA